MKGCFRIMSSAHVLRSAVLLLAASAASALAPLPIAAQAPVFEVTLAPNVHDGPLTGRLVLVISQSGDREPRLTIAPQGPAIYGVDLDQVGPDDVVRVDGAALAYPMPLPELPAGDYFAQAVINVYEQVSRADGHTIWVPFNDGTQETFSISEGNLYSDVQPVRIGDGGTVRLRIDNVIPAREPPADTEWLKHVTVRSDMLSEFWGRPVFVHARVLLPKGYDADGGERYPVVYTFGHSVPFGFTTDSTRVRNPGEINPVTGLETGYDFYRAWNADDFPRMIAISFQQQTPYFPDSYSVNSANNGPYGDALLQEVIPALESRFRILSAPHARLVEGASTGGWQALALQLKHPDHFGGAWIFQPDPIDFRSYQLIDIYEDENAFEIANSQFTTIDRPFRRTVRGQPAWTVRQLSLFEAVLGSRGRSGYQLEGWESVYGPVGDDGYPVPLWDKLTGDINRDVAEHMRANGYDLREYAERNWATIGPKLVGKLHFFLPDMDDFYLNLAMYRFEEFLQGTTDPHYTGEWAYGRPMKGHSWHAYPWAELVRRMAAHVEANAPE